MTQSFKRQLWLNLSRFLKFNLNFRQDELNPFVVHANPLELAHSVIAECLGWASIAFLTTLGSGINTGTFVFPLRVSIMPSLIALGDNLRASEGSRPQYIIKAIGSNM